MPSDSTLQEKSRSELLEKARSLGLDRPERMTREELRDEIIRRTVPESQQAGARGLFGVARSMLASVVESGLNLPDAAKVIRGESSFEIPTANQTPVATVTLAEIYAAQGHTARARRILEDVLAAEPEHDEAQRVLRELGGEQSPAPRRTLAPLSNTEERDALTAQAPSVVELEGATTHYVPGGFLETTGEEIETGRPPEVVSVEAVAPEAVGEPDPTEPVDPAVGEPDPAEPVDPGNEGQEQASPRTEPFLVLAQTRDGLSLYWELPREATERFAQEGREGHPALRIVGFAPSGTAPARAERKIALNSTMKVHSESGREAGRLTVPDFAEPVAVRAALVWETAQGFLPLAVGRWVEEWGADRAATGMARRASTHL